MKVIYFLLCIAYVNGQRFHLKPIQRLETIQYGKYATDSNHIRNANSSITLGHPITDTPEVKSAKKAHEDTYNYLNSISLTQANPNMDIQKQQLKNNRNDVARKALSEISHNTLIQSYLEAKKKSPLKNIKNTLDNIGNLLESSSTQNSGKKNHLTTSPPTLVHVDNNKIFQLPVNNDSFTSAITHQQKSAEHLKALRNVISLQLLSYNGDPQSTKIPSTLQVQSSHNEKNTLAEENKSYIDNMDVEMQKKLAIIAAARALMEILDA